MTQMQQTGLLISLISLGFVGVMTDKDLHHARTLIKISLIGWQIIALYMFLNGGTQ